MPPLRFQVTGDHVKTLIASLGAETAAFAISILWLLFIQFLAVLAWDAELLTRQAALLHWVVVGVLPPALTLAGMNRAR